MESRLREFEVNLSKANQGLKSMNTQVNSLQNSNLELENQLTAKEDDRANMEEDLKKLIEYKSEMEALLE